jgi:hypothetical protein
MAFARATMRFEIVDAARRVRTANVAARPASRVRGLLSSKAKTSPVIGDEK